MLSGPSGSYASAQQMSTLVANPLSIPEHLPPKESESGFQPMEHIASKNISGERKEVGTNHFGSNQGGNPEAIRQDQYNTLKLHKEIGDHDQDDARLDNTQNTIQVRDKQRFDSLALCLGDLDHIEENTKGVDDVFMPVSWGSFSACFTLSQTTDLEVDGSWDLDNNEIHATRAQSLPTIPPGSSLDASLDDFRSTNDEDPFELELATGAHWRTLRAGMTSWSRRSQSL
jgi:hypothetical protein